MLPGKELLAAILKRRWERFVGLEFCSVALHYAVLERRYQARIPLLSRYLLEFIADKLPPE